MSEDSEQQVSMPHGCGGEPPSGRLRGTAARRAIQDAMAVVPILVTKIELWRPERLIPLERNPRTQSDQQIDVMEMASTGLPIRFSMTRSPTRSWTRFWAPRSSRGAGMWHD